MTVQKCYNKTLVMCISNKNFFIKMYFYAICTLTRSSKNKINSAIYWSLSIEKLYCYLKINKINREVQQHLIFQIKVGQSKKFYKRSFVNRFNKTILMLVFFCKTIN